MIENVGPQQPACLSLRRHLGRRLSLLVLTQVLIKMMPILFFSDGTDDDDDEH